MKSVCASFEYVADNSHCSGVVWPAAVSFCKYVQANDIVDVFVMRRVLELGSGTGWMALNLAHLLRAQGAVVIATEMDEHGCFDRLHLSVQTNAVKFEPCVIVDGKESEESAVDSSALAGRRPSGRMEVRTLDWCAADQGLSYSWDLLVGSDLVYNDATVRLLCKAIVSLLRSKCREQGHVVARCEQPSPNHRVCTASCMYYAHSLYRWGEKGFDKVFQQCLRANNLSAHIMWLEGVGSDPSLIRQLMSEPPQQRVALFCIRLLKEHHCDKISSCSTTAAASHDSNSPIPNGIDRGIELHTPSSELLTADTLLHITRWKNGYYDGKKDENAREEEEGEGEEGEGELQDFFTDINYINYQ